MKKHHICLLGLLILQALGGCSRQAPANATDVPSNLMLQCAKDTDCKGERICEGGTCKNPASSQTASSAIAPQTKPTPVISDEKLNKASLERLIKDYATREVKSINAEEKKHNGEDAYQYYLANKSIQEHDLNADGHPDYIASLTYCEETSCNTSTRSTEALVITADPSNGYRLVDTIGLGFEGNVTAVKDGVISATELDYGEDDPTCCPSKQIKHSFKVIGSKLEKIN